MDVNKRTARAAGILYLVIILGSIMGGVFTEMYLQSKLAEGALNPANAIDIPEGLYRIGFFIYLIVYTSDLATALILYVLLRPVNRSIALLAAFFRFAEATIIGLNMLNHYNAFLLLSGGDLLGAIPSEQVQAMASFLLSAHRSGYLIGQVFFGVHCFFLGYLLVKSGYFPRFIGVVLIAASFGYLTESFGYFLLANFAQVESIFTWIVAVPAFISEIALTYWLLFKGDVIEKKYNESLVTT